MRILPTWRCATTLREHAVAATSDTAPRVFIEPKTFGFGVHTRTADAADARELANELCRRHRRGGGPAWRRRTGHNIVEYAFRHEGRIPPSPTCASGWTPPASCSPGDDITDEDALSSLGPEDLGVHIGAGLDGGHAQRARSRTFAEFLSELARLRAAGVRRTSAPDPASAADPGIDSARGNALGAAPRSISSPQRASSPTASRRPHRAGMLRAVGMGDDDWDKPQIGIASAGTRSRPAT